MTMQISQITSQDAEALEYLSTLVTVELAAEIHKDRPNSAIKRTVVRLLPRMEFARVRSIFIGVTRQAFPVGSLCMLRRELEELLK